jgi:hypothetical protein
MNELELIPSGLSDLIMLEELRAQIPWEVYDPVKRNSKMPQGFFIIGYKFNHSTLLRGIWLMVWDYNVF